MSREILLTPILPLTEPQRGSVRRPKLTLFHPDRAR
jgi:hypothetical protein